MQLIFLFFYLQISCYFGDFIPIKCKNIFSALDESEYARVASNDNDAASWHSKINRQAM